MDIQTEIDHTLNTLPTGNNNLAVVDSCNEFIQLFCQFQDQISFRERMDKKKSVFANRTIKEGSRIAQVPYAYFINAQLRPISSNFLQYIYKIKEELQKDDQAQYMRKEFQYLFRQNQDQSIIQIQILVYLIQKGCMKRSIHWSKQVDKVHSLYMDNLPKNYQTHPVNHINVIEFRHQPIQMRLLHTSKQVERYYEAFSKILGSQTYLQIFLEYFNECHLVQQYRQAFSYENIKWALMVYQTRSFNKMGLVPMFDLFNYSAQPNAQISFDSVFRKAVLNATKDIGPNEQIVINFAPDRSIQELYAAYGFVSVNQICQTDLAFVRDSIIFYRRMAYYLPKYEKKSFFKYIYYNIYESAQFFGDQILPFSKIFFRQCQKKQEFYDDIKIEYENLLKNKQTTVNEANTINDVLKIIGIEEMFIRYMMEQKEPMVKMLTKLKRLKRQLQ